MRQSSSFTARGPTRWRDTSRLAPRRCQGQVRRARGPAGDPWVVEKLREAGQRALGNGAAKSAVAYFSRALGEPPSAEVKPAVLRELGSAEVRIGVTDGISHLQEALEAATEHSVHAAV